MNSSDKSVKSAMANNVHILDCTLRDGGYYTNWDFPVDVINEYFEAMKAANVDVVELGFRFLANSGFKGACAYTTDEFIRSLMIPAGLRVAIMINGADLLTELGLEATLRRLVPNPRDASPVDLVRIACRLHEVKRILPAIDWLAEQGYQVALNLMQITEHKREDVVAVATEAKQHPLEVLYFADSLGNMTPDDVVRITGWLREGWDGTLGVHTHNNLGLALSNTLTACSQGVTWLDSTVTGMGRGAGNARTEELMIEVADMRGQHVQMNPIMGLIRRYFGPLRDVHGWGANPYYYLSGKYSIHSTYVQQMLADPCYTDEDIIAVLESLREMKAQNYKKTVLEEARTFYRGKPLGTWDPKPHFEGREVLIIASGPGAARHKDALEAYILKAHPVVIAMNTQTAIASDLIDYRVACHPVRLLADADTHRRLPQPLITPASMLPDNLTKALAGKELVDFGMVVEPGVFSFAETHCVVPSSLVLAYSLAATASGKAKRVLMAGFDGYPAGDARNDETGDILTAFFASSRMDLLAVTPTRHRLVSASIYAL